MYYDDFIESGMVRANIVSPIISNKGTITYEEAKNILETHNFYLIDNNYKENTKKLLELMQMFNLAANINPEKAEEIATEILDSIHSIDDKKNTNGKKLVKKKNHK